MRKYSGVQFNFHYAFHVDGPNYCKPAMKGGHTHNHVKNANKRMENRMHKCHSCGELFPKGIKHFVCNSCVEKAKIEAALDMYEKFNGIIRNQ